MSNVPKIEEAGFDAEVLGSELPVLIDFYADWCGPCRMIGPVVEEIAVEYGEKLMVARVDVDAAQDIAMRYSIMSIPTLGFFRGGKMVDRLVGYPGPRGVKDWVSKNATVAA
jgi:thioredoxin 1